jgi:phage terminase small subunit
MARKPDADEGTLPSPKRIVRKPAAKRTPPKKKVVGSVIRKRAAAPPPDLDDEVDNLDDDCEGEGAATVPASRRMPDRQQAELMAAVKAKLTGQPMFAFPPELKDEHKPYWTETVNSKPHDYFNNGDIHLLKLYCRVAADIDRLDLEIAAEGSVVLNNRNNPIVNPRVIVRTLAETRLMVLSTKLRLQPASRYDSGNDKKQGVKKKRADAALRSMEDDDEDLLAGSDGGISANRTVQ